VSTTRYDRQPFTFPDVAAAAPAIPLSKYYLMLWGGIRAAVAIVFIFITTKAATGRIHALIHRPL